MKIPSSIVFSFSSLDFIIRVLKKDCYFLICF